MRSIPLLLLASLAGSCAPGPPPEPSLTVFAAASLTEAMQQLGQRYRETTGTPVRNSFGASSTLARQIADGAPADLYFSADRSWVELLQDQRLIEAEPELVARNEIVCIVGRGERRGWEGPEQLAANPPEELALADRGVPAGDYARQALLRAGVWTRLEPRVVGQRDVRAVLGAVAGGHARAGLVYATDAIAFSDRVRVSFRIEPRLHDPVAIFGTRLKAAAPEAEDYLRFITGPEGREVFEALGFGVP